MTTYQTNLVRAAAAAALGAPVGGVIVALAVLASNIGGVDAGNLLRTLIDLSATSTMLVALGLAVLACPLWWLLDRAGLRTPLAAIALGAALGFLAALGSLVVFAEQAEYLAGDVYNYFVIDDAITSKGWKTFLWWAFWHGVACSVAGFVVWRVAYRRAF